MGYFLIPICVAFAFLSFDSYARVTSSSFIVNRFFSFGEVEYTFDKIRRIELTKSFKAPNGNIKRTPYYSIEFVDNTSYDFHWSLHDLDFGQQQEVAEYVSSLAGNEIMVVDPYP